MAFVIFRLNDSGEQEVVRVLPHTQFAKEIEDEINEILENISDRPNGAGLAGDDAARMVDGGT